MPAFESILVKQGATPGDIAWVEAHNLEYPELRVEQQPQRRYPDNGSLAHVLGYVGEISPEQLKQQAVKDKGLKPGDIIGLSGIEQIYDDYLRGRDGYREVVVDSRGRIQDEIETVPPIPGRDLVTTIDLDLQNAAEEQLANSATKRGVIIAMDPNNGEILALASAPTFDPNLFSQRITTKEGRAEYAALLNDPKRPYSIARFRVVILRVRPGRFRWPLPDSSKARSHSIIQIWCAAAVSRSATSSLAAWAITVSPDVKTAITHSCDGYFYRLGLKMGIDGIVEMVDEFDLNKRTGIDLPNEVVSWTPSREFKRDATERSRMARHRTVYSSFGQVYDIITPISLLRTLSAVSIGGRMYIPHLLKEVRADRQSGNT